MIWNYPPIEPPTSPPDIPVIDRKREALASDHYDIDDINDCFSSADLKKLDAMVRAGDHTEAGRFFDKRTKEFRQHRLEVAISWEEEEAER